ncbi:hypothetical protein FRACA_480028 [Frankia canadensis]|uniref:Uncharacterized protein n=1 Tax=Frankia canadensis TaxID=1836972 RepID=A0A2I2KY05_9ACTN|nr:hypothetical protein FRACA_480028 [Frankia canadensis]SOU57829.1 hypothetical protein FRACA_480028 [Frankia canadensis]
MRRPCRRWGLRLVGRRRWRHERRQGDDVVLLGGPGRGHGLVRELPHLPGPPADPGGGRGDLHLTICAAPEAPAGDHIGFAYKLLAAVNEYLIACETHQLDAEDAATTAAEPADRLERRAA